MNVYIRYIGSDLQILYELTNQETNNPYILVVQLTNQKNQWIECKGNIIIPRLRLYIIHI